MKLLKNLLMTILCHAAALSPGSAHSQTAGTIQKPISGLIWDSGLLLQPYIHNYSYAEIANSPEVAPRSSTEASMHLYTSNPSQSFLIDLMVRVDLLANRNFEQFEIRLSPAVKLLTGHARIWLWRSGKAAVGLSGWNDLSLPGVLGGKVSGMAYPLVRDSFTFGRDSIELDILNALNSAQASKGDLILIENLDQPEGTTERFARALTIKAKSEVFRREFAQGLKRYRSGAYQTKAPEGNMVIFPKVVSQVTPEGANGSIRTNIALKLGGSEIQFGLQSLFVNGTRADGPMSPGIRWGHTVPQALSFKTVTPSLPAGATLKIYKGKSLVRTMPLASGGTIDLSGIEDLRARQFTSSNQYELLMIVSWAGRDYGFLELYQGEQINRRPIVQGASLPY